MPLARRILGITRIGGLGLIGPCGNCAVPDPTRLDADTANTEAMRPETPRPDGENGWERRSGLLLETVLAFDPDLLDSCHFWLSETPDQVASRSWGCGPHPHGLLGAGA